MYRGKSFGAAYMQLRHGQKPEPQGLIVAGRVTEQVDVFRGPARPFALFLGAGKSSGDAAGIERHSSSRLRCYRARREALKMCKVSEGRLSLPLFVGSL